jgi:hypothetical protein
MPITSYAAGASTLFTFFADPGTGKLDLSSSAALVRHAIRGGLRNYARSRYLNCDTRSASSRISLALSAAAVPVASPLNMILGLDQ